jgi:catechol 2,3-dioxygenase-like lactoylglutathione lyase family enzyme
MRLTHAPVVVSNQDDALAFYTDVLGFEKRADYQQPGKPRWLTVGLAGEELELILVQGRSAVDLGLGPEAGSGGYHVGLASTDCRGDFERLKARGVDFTVGSYTEPIAQAWGTSASFKDPDGNQFALVQPNIVGKVFSALTRLKR